MASIEPIGNRIEIYANRKVCVCVYSSMSETGSRAITEERKESAVHPPSDSDHSSIVSFTHSTFHHPARGLPHGMWQLGVTQQSVGLVSLTHRVRTFKGMSGDAEHWSVPLFLEVPTSKLCSPVLHVSDYYGNQTPDCTLWFMSLLAVFI